LETGHVGLNVSDLERSKKFYQDVFGLEIMGRSNQQGRRYVFLSKNHKLLLTLWQQSEGRFESRLPGLHHLSFQVANIDQVQEAEARLRELGVRFQYDGIVPHGEGMSSGGVFFEDPDGIRLEIYSETGAEKKEAPVAGAPSCGFF
jgi:catechol 2,3-dioxygenase-like lactoylglutathione lyase family enzyme